MIEEYEARRNEQISKEDLLKPKIPLKAAVGFWIEAGYVTKNRGKEAPGNQIFFPKGFGEFFKLPSMKIEKKNSVIGPVNLTTLVGPPVTNDLRLNRNGMEKMSLPIPETHGFGVYDGKVLVFEPVGGAFRMSALEANEFDAVYGHRLVDIRRMNGGRRYGAIVK